MKTLQKYYRIDRKEISFLKFIIEAYDGIALLRTVDPAAGIVALHISPGCEPVVDMILNDLKQEIMIEDMNRPTCEIGLGAYGFENPLPEPCKSWRENE